uniref:Lipase_3 domain-containing protein n=1 Tax=Caenorhabditis tropicalis TaxID=1561998 RepID=A0A1I7V3K5_9PELO
MPVRCRTILGILLICIIGAHTLVDYDSDSGRRFLIWALCIGATNPEKCVETEFYGQLILATFEADCSDLIFGGTCRVVIDVDDGYTLLGITFKAESKIESTTSTLLNQQALTNFGTYGQVQTDFLTAFGRLWNNGLGAYMRQLWTEYCDLYISFSGYSMGACLAQMAAVRFQEEKWWPADQMFYFGYGSPRCGNEDFAYYVDTSLADKFNIVWFNDQIPEFPTSTCTFGSPAALGQCTNGYFSCCTTIQYTSWSSVALNTYSTCTSNTCPVSTPTASDHYTYFETTAADVNSLTCTDTKKFP